MSEDSRKLCIGCAWRGNCAKRFSMGDDATLHCPDFTEDITLRKRTATPAPPVDGELQE
jgi:hypothetical protein